MSTCRFFFVPSPNPMTASNMLNSKTYDYWQKKIELTKTHVTRKREIIHPNVDIYLSSFLVLRHNNIHLVIFNQIPPTDKFISTG